MPLDLATAIRHLDIWLSADAAVATGQAYTVSQGGSQRQLTRTNAAEIRQNIDYWQAKVNQLSGASRVRHVVPL